MNSTENNILVLGIGNLLLGDEGVGVQAVQLLENMRPDCSFDILDGGTGGFHLLSILESYDNVIIVDATMDGQTAGAVSLIEPRFASDYPPSLSAHDVGLKDLIGSLYLLGTVPKIYLITVSIEGIQPMTMDLTEPVYAGIQKVHEMVFNLSEIILKDASINMA